METLANIGKFFNGDFWATVEGVITTITLFLVVKGLLDSNKQEKFIEIVLYYKETGKHKALDVKLKRKNFTRSELKGVLSDAHAGRNYKIKYINNEQFISDIEKVQNGELDIFEIKIEKDDDFALIEDTPELA